jgi:thymidine kinase
MANQLKQALINAGIVTKDKLKDLERENVKKRHLKSGAKMREDHLRIVCEACEKTAPDVERYGHKNRMLENKQWLCLKCADQYQILDDCRLTHQSSQAKQGMFIRQYGRTKKF